jgi:hypothetical protein
VPPQAEHFVQCRDHIDFGFVIVPPVPPHFGQQSFTGHSTMESIAPLLPGKSGTAFARDLPDM